jgi:hypothetical protein
MYNLFKQIADKHLLIQSFGYGELDDIEPFIGTNKLYTMMWVSLDNTTVENQMIRREYNIIVGELLLNGRENYVDILDQSESICFDIMNILFQNGQNTYEVIGSPSITPFTERFSETLAGSTLNIVIETDNDFSMSGNCNVMLIDLINYDPNEGTDDRNTK